MSSKATTKTNPCLLAVFALAAGLASACMEPAPQEEEAEGSVGEAVQQLEQAGDAFLEDARGAMTELGTRIDQLETRYAGAQGEAATEWNEARQEITQVRQEIEADLAELRTASAEEAEEIRGRVAENMEQLTQRVETASLSAIEGGQEFMVASQEKLSEIDEDIESLMAESDQLSLRARSEVSQSIEELRSQAEDLRQTVSAMADSAPQEVAQQKDQIVEAIASLSASVRREWFELRQDLQSQ